MYPLEMLFVVALVLYSFVIWTHKFQKKLHTWMVWLFGAGVLADFGGTIFLCVASATKWTFTFHTISGLFSLLVMALHFVWALFAVTAHGKFESYFNRFSVAAWCLWFSAFISGIPFEKMI